MEDASLILNLTVVALFQIVEQTWRLPIFGA
jgi:hypothetical protein